MAINNYYPSPYNYQYGNAGMGLNGGFVPSGASLQPNGYSYSPNTIPNAQNGNFAQVAPASQIQQQGNTTNVPWVYVPSLDSAKQIFCAPSQTIYIMNQNKPEFYVKSANEMGVVDMKVCPFNTIGLAEYEQGLSANANAEQASFNNEFLPRSEFNAFVNNLSQELNSVRQMVSETAQNGIVATPNTTAKAASKKAKENVE